jgi:hypothetical protein
MKRELFVIFMLWAAGLFAGKQDFTLVNKTGVEIFSVFVSPTKVAEWGEDILGRDTLPPGESVDIIFDRSEKAKYWDLMVTDEDGNALTWEKLNLLEISTVTIYYDAKKDKGWAETD